ncbi:MAG: coiled-coil domain-containing protein [Planctomycetota bacterium]
MSTLTKILIVVLTISSIFLCGIVVTYVANADDYRKKYNNLRRETDSLRETSESKVKAFNEIQAEKERLENKLNSEIAALNTEISTLKGQLKEANNENKIMVQRVSDMASVVETSTQTTGEQGQLLKDTLTKLNNVQAEQIKLKAHFDDTTKTLLEKLAIIQSLETDKKRLVEEKTELQARMDKLLQPTGKTTTPVVTTTPPKIEIARPVPVIAEKIGLKGLINAVDLKNKMASISIGTADGVKEGMKFHVTRGDKFVCDLLIIDTDTEVAVGAMELLDLAKEQPKVGDTVTTNL